LYFWSSLSLFSSSSCWSFVVHHVSLRPSTTLSSSFSSPPSSLRINLDRYFRLQSLYSEFIFPLFPLYLPLPSFYFMLLKVLQEFFHLIFSVSMTESILPALLLDPDLCFLLARFLVCSVCSAILANLALATSVHLCSLLKRFSILIFLAMWISSYSLHFLFSTLHSSLFPAPHSYWWLLDLISRSLKLTETLYC
jgi:hypothetical protein